MKKNDLVKEQINFSMFFYINCQNLKIFEQLLSELWPFEIQDGRRKNCFFHVFPE